MDTRIRRKLFLIWIMDVIGLEIMDVIRWEIFEYLKNDYKAMLISFIHNQYRHKYIISLHEDSRIDHTVVLANSLSEFVECIKSNQYIMGWIAKHFIRDKPGILSDLHTLDNLIIKWKENGYKENLREIFDRINDEDFIDNIETYDDDYNDTYIRVDRYDSEKIFM